MITLTSMTAASMLDCTDRKPTYQYEGTLQKFNEKLLQVSVGKKENEAFYLLFSYIWVHIYIHTYMYTHRDMYICVLKMYLTQESRNQDLVLLSPEQPFFSWNNVTWGVKGCGSLVSS